MLPLFLERGRQITYFSHAQGPAQIYLSRADLWADLIILTQIYCKFNKHFTVLTWGGMDGMLFTKKVENTKHWANRDYTGLLMIILEGGENL